ncbi:MAG TPA: hypothetical protein VHU44_04075 [Acidobacteriaceae bacterium]|jgi:hypothetical protein|nr:hypothetical protein [Acidobacteriaceae bacterium]
MRSRNARTSRLTKDIAEGVEVVQVIIRRYLVEEVTEFLGERGRQSGGMVRLVQEFAEGVLLLGDAADRMEKGVEQVTRGGVFGGRLGCDCLSAGHATWDACAVVTVVGGSQRATGCETVS